MYTLSRSQDVEDTKSVVAAWDTLRTIHRMEKWQDRIRSLMKTESVTQESLKSVLGVSTRGAVGHYLQGRREPSVKQLADLSKFFGVELNWLVSGTGPKSYEEAKRQQQEIDLEEIEWSQTSQFYNTVNDLMSEGVDLYLYFGLPPEELDKILYENSEIPSWMFHKVGINSPELEAHRHRSRTGRPHHNELDFFGHIDAWDSNTELDEDEVELPLFREVELAAGCGQTQVIENHGAKLRFAKSTLAKAGVMAENAACAFLKGNSMHPVMPDGTTVGVNTGDKTVRDGEIYAIDHEGMLRVKYLHRRPGGGIKIVSQNAGEHPVEEYTAEQASASIRVIGRVFWWSVLR